MALGLLDGGPSRRGVLRFGVVRGARHRTRQEGSPRLDRVPRALRRHRIVSAHARSRRAQRLVRVCRNPSRSCIGDWRALRLYCPLVDCEAAVSQSRHAAGSELHPWAAHRAHFRDVEFYPHGVVPLDAARLAGLPRLDCRAPARGALLRHLPRFHGDAVCQPPRPEAVDVAWFRPASRVGFSHGWL